MKVTNVEAFLVPPRWVFVRVQTDEGITGWGEPGGEARPRTVVAAVRDLGDYLVGRNPLEIERHWQMMTKSAFYRGGPVFSGAVAGVDQALWDIAGKARGVPVHELLGGPVRDRMRVYSWIGADQIDDLSPGEIAAQASARIVDGFTAVKMNAASQLLPVDSPAAADKVIERVAAVREAIGPEHGIAIDFHGRVSVAMAHWLLPLLEPFHPMFVEEAVLPEYPEAFTELARKTSIPLATGERLYSRWDFKHILGKGIAIVQPDPSHAGGISETLRIASMADAYGMLLAPHSAVGPIGLAAALQVDFVASNAFIQEQGLGYTTGLLDQVLDDSMFTYQDGHAPRPTGPGLGIEIDEKAVEKIASSGHAWSPPPWTYPDGGRAEW